MDKSEVYEKLLISAHALMDPACGTIANMANLTAAIQQEFGFWWCGFYLVNRQGALELGPFQGPVACTRIEYGKGVCGTAWKLGKSIVVPDVHAFEGHIACSSQSNSEIVVPVWKNNSVYAVLDIDSTEFSKFDETDRIYLEKLVALIP